jgi:hypothetical protein
MALSFSAKELPGRSWKLATVAGSTSAKGVAA